ncbi:alpha,alpha-trehalase TreF [Roseateles saccharophilus]|uniref:Alpha,alpha-trehalase n=1 Tax=Roseateles saccharophilus TaxID=304 RepID=A0A4R3VE78_ROSSA|nr:alpha,alpha-trehalase TreF [Roseateles saccharophilus]MDG0835581.1 alpha,alpha-trehalase TreF [Roseateles saccharophilus]TCV01055.1 alpha,alpha-trehalase [Roseateles saccharophilus]
MTSSRQRPGDPLAAAPIHAVAPATSRSTATPHDLYGELFVDVQMQRVFGDGKSFVDARPKAPPALIRARFEAERRLPGFSLPGFVHAHFALPGHAAASGPRLGIREHIQALWPLLVREHRDAQEGDSLLPLPRPYVVPGGRFRELYYWDSYFTMLGLAADGRRELAEDMLANFAELIHRHGFIPNSSRSYMLSRSQPPFFFKMVELLHEGDPATGFAAHLQALRAEHAFWMDGEAGLAPGQAHRRVLRLADGALANRYWDDRCTPREESWREDVGTAEKAGGRPREQVWRDLRAGAESGWDFSGRWCADPADIASIETTAIAPVDLNALLAGLEDAIALGAARSGDAATAGAFEARAALRRQLLQTRFWLAQDGNGSGHFTDLHRTDAQARRPLTAAALVPLYLGIATQAQADAMAAQVQARLLGANGLLSTTLNTGQQWDAPNGWAPLQWMAAQGLVRYGHAALARDIAERWCASVHRVYLATGRLLEKYDVAQDRPGGGGEYETQDGFGWTNGVFVAFKDGLLKAPAP